MKSIVNNALAFPNCEAPGAAAPDIKPAQDSTVSSGAEPGFAKELKDCENKIPPDTQNPKPPDEEKGDAQTSDNGMPDDPSKKVAAYGIVGILEGFEPPGYQPDNTACTTEGSVAPVSPQPVQNNGAAQASENVTPASGEGASGLPEQFARMLQNNEAGTKPAQTQEQILEIVGDYLDSMENTNNQVSGTTPGKQAAGLSAKDADSAQNVLPQTETAGADKAENVKTAAAIPEAPVKLEGVPKPDEAAADVAFQKAAGATKPADGMIKPAEASPKAAETKAEDTKPIETVKTDIKVSANVPNGETVNAAGIAADKAQAEQAAQPKTEAEPAVRETVLKIVDRVSTAASDGKYDFDIDLKPDFMGKVNIKLTMEDGSVKVQIKADDISVKGMLSDQMSNLHYMLKEKGIPVTTIDVSLGSGTMSGQEESAGQYERRNPQGNAAYEQTSEGAFDSAKERYDFYLGGSYVEYLA